MVNLLSNLFCKLWCLNRFLQHLLLMYNPLNVHNWPLKCLCLLVKQCFTLYALRMQKSALAPINFYFMKHEQGLFLRKAQLCSALKVGRICALRFDSALMFYEIDPWLQFFLQPTQAYKKWPQSLKTLKPMEKTQSV